MKSRELLVNMLLNRAQLILEWSDMLRAEREEEWRKYGSGPIDNADHISRLELFESDVREMMFSTLASLRDEEASHVEPA